MESSEVLKDRRHCSEPFKMGGSSGRRPLSPFVKKKKKVKKAHTLYN